MPNYTDRTVAQLRAIVAVIDQEIVRVPPPPAFRAAWTELVDALALGPAPETRECPTCHGVGMRTARRCGRCWTALAPLPPLSDGAPR